MTSLRARARLLSLTLAGLALVSVASAAFVGIGDNEVKFQAKGPAGMTISGTSGELSAAEVEGKLTIKVPLTNLKTGIELRDKHLQGYLGTAEFPNATLVVARSALSLPENDKTVEAKATGNFTLHGVTKPVEFRYKAKRTGSDYHVQGRAGININDFGIETPCYLGVCVDPNVKIAVKFKLRDKS